MLMSRGRDHPLARQAAVPRRSIRKGTMSAVGALQAPQPSKRALTLVDPLKRAELYFS